MNPPRFQTAVHKRLIGDWGVIMRVLFAMVAALSLVSVAAADQAEASIRRHTEIPAQGLGAALQSFAADRGIAMVYRTELVSKVNTPGATGNLTLDEALTELLSGTRLTYKLLDDKTVTIVPLATAPVSSRNGETAASGIQEGFLLLAQSENQSAKQTDAADKGTASSSSENSSSTKSSEVQEILVTAQKREERLQDVPISITVLEGRQLDRSTEGGLLEVLNRVPGVFADTSPAMTRIGGTSSNIFIRGVGPSGVISTGQSPTAYYLDSIPFGFVRQAFAPDTTAYDLDRVEILLGPQGTLYGLSAVSGVVRVLTKDADLDKYEFKARASTSYTESGGENYRGDMAVNVPIMPGKLAARFVAGHQNWSGWIDRPSTKNSNDSQVSNFRLKVNAQPTDRLSLSLLAWANRGSNDAPPQSADGKVSSNRFHEENSGNYEAYGFTGKYQFPAFQLTSMTSYIDYRSAGTFDFAPFPFLTFDQLVDTHINSKVLAEEVTLNSTIDGPWRWSLGGIYRDAEDRYKQVGYDPVTGMAIGAAPLGNVWNATSKSFAVFGELTRTFLDDRLELTGGLRYFNDKVRDAEYSRANFINGTVNPATGQFGLGPDQNNRFTKVTPRLILNWHPADQATVYVSYSEGFRSGINQTPFVRGNAPFDLPPAGPDDLKNYELGAKGNFWGGRILVDSAVYYMKWHNVQTQYTNFITPTLSLNTISNTPGASGPGFDFGVTARPTDRWSLNASYSWNDLKTDADLVQLGRVIYPEGSRLRFSPKYTAGASAAYSFPIGDGGYTGSVSVSARYRTSQEDFTGFTYVDSMSSVRSQLQIQGPGHWTATLYGDNLLNEDGVIREPGFPRANIYTRPRTIGLQFEYR